MIVDLTKHEFALIPGPRTLAHDPADSQEFEHIENILVEDAMRLILSCPHVSLRYDGGGDLWKWRALWRDGNHQVEIHFSMMGQNNEFWGGSSLLGSCDCSALIELLNGLRKSNPCVYIHDGNCSVYTPTSLKQRLLGAEDDCFGG